MNADCTKCQLIKLFQDELKRKNKLVKKLRKEKQIKIEFSSN